jgi:hypothetical protein
MAGVGEQPADAFRQTEIVELVLNVVRQFFWRV